MKKIYFLMGLIFLTIIGHSQSVVVNKYQNAGTTADIVELLVIQDNADLRNLVLKDFSSSNANDGGGNFTFTNISFWNQLRAGTVIVLRAGSSTATDITTSCTDFNLDIGLSNTTYFTSAGSFDISTNDMIMIKSGTTSGTANNIHTLRAGSAGTQWTSIASGIRIGTTSTVAANSYAVVDNASSVIGDFNLGTTGVTVTASATFGSSNNANNANFIIFLRGPVSIAGSGATSTAFDANWNSLTGAVSYLIDVDDNSDFSSPVTGYNALNVGNVTTYAVTGLNSSTTYFYRVRAVNATPTTSGNSCSQSITTLAGALPNITTSVTSLTSFGPVIAGNNSTERNYTVEGANLTTNLDVTAPAGVEVSLTSGSYTGTTGNTISLTPSSGAVSTTNIYARFSPATATGFLNTNITNASTGATTRNVNVQGYAVVAEPTVQSTISFVSSTTTTMDLSLSGGNGTARLVVAKSGSAVSTDPSDGPTYLDGGGIFGNGTDLGSGNFVVYDGTNTSISVTGLTAGTTYHFAVYSYNSSGVGTSNYLTPGGTTSGSTAAPPITTYTWTGGNSAWTTASNWTPTRTTPEVTDILQFNDGATVTITAVPAQTIGKLSVTNNTSVTLQAGAANTLTIAGGTGTDLDIASGSQLNVSGASVLIIALPTGATGSVSGSMTLAGGAHRLTSVDGNSITFASGATFTTGASFSGNPFGTANLNSIVFANGSTYSHGAGGNPFGAVQPNSVITFQTGSLFRMIADAGPSLSGRTYANFEINAAAFNQSPTGGNPLTLDNLTITDGIFNINLTGGINIKGNISVATGETLTFTPASASTITFNGTSAQSINNSGTLAFGSNASVSIDNSAGVTLNTPVTVGSGGTLTLTSGILTIGNNNLAATATAGGSATSYVRTNGTGTLTINNITAAAKTFPIGNATYNPLTIANGSGHNWAARVSNAINNVQAPFNTNKAVLRTWHITPSTNPPAAGADLTFQYNDGDLTQLGGSYINTEDVQLWHYGVAWIAASGAITPTGTAGGVRTITRTGWSQYSDFAIANISGPLPVTFISFSGYKDGGRNQLRWTTVTETNNSGFDVQRSTDGINYVSVGFVNSLAPGGNSSDAITYNFTDNAPAGTKQFYRLRQVDIGGAAKLSNVVLIRGGKPGSIAIDGLFPNPARQAVNVIVAAPKKDNITLVVTDMAGRTVSQRMVNVETGSNTIPVDLSRLNSGTYLVRIICSGGCDAGTGRFVKQ